MSSNAKPDNRIDYLELPALDLPAIKRFYTSVFGWSFTDYGPRYSSFSDGCLDGGFTLDGAPPARGVLIVIYARDLDAVQDKIRKADGKIVKERSVVQLTFCKFVGFHVSCCLLSCV